MYDKEFFTYAYLSLLRGMSDDESERQAILKRIYICESSGLLISGLRPTEKMDSFMWKYGLNIDYLK